MIRVRGSRAYILLRVVEHRTTRSTATGTTFEVVLRDTGGDADEVIVRSPWVGLFDEFPIGRVVDGTLEKQ